MQPHIPALILAGGTSSRMGRNKALIELGGKRLLDRAVDCLTPQTRTIVINSNSAITTPGNLAVLADVTPEPYGPLSGILTGMDHFKATDDVSHFLTVSVDCPFLPHDLIARLATPSLSDEMVAIAASGGRQHPTIALWPVAMRDRLQAFIATTQSYAVNAFLDQCEMTFVDFQMIDTADGPVDPFFNINSPDDLAVAQRYLAAFRAGG